MPPPTTTTTTYTQTPFQMPPEQLAAMLSAAMANISAVVPELQEGQVLRWVEAGGEGGGGKVKVEHQSTELCPTNRQ